MDCGFCGRVLPDELPESSCGTCRGGCKKIHCPWCGYANPAPPKLLKKILNDRTKRED